MEDNTPSVKEDFEVGANLTFNNVFRLGKLFAASGFFQDAKDQAQAAVKIILGQEYGLSPAAAMSNVYLVKGKPSLSASAMAGVIKNHGYDYRITQLTDSACDIEFFNQKGESLGVSSFDMDDARSAGLNTGDNYRKFPRNMLFARAMSNGCKWYCSDCFGSSPVYTPDELGEVIDITAPQIASSDTQDMSNPTRTETAQKSKKSRRHSPLALDKETSQEAQSLAASLADEPETVVEIVDSLPLE